METQQPFETDLVFQTNRDPRNSLERNLIIAEKRFGPDRIMALLRQIEVPMPQSKPLLD
jgi:hypothetical protein